MTTFAVSAQRSPRQRQPVMIPSGSIARDRTHCARPPTRLLADGVYQAQTR